MFEGKKRIFLALVLGSIVVYGSLCLVAAYILSNRSPDFNRLVAITVMAAFLGLMLLMVVGSFGLVVSLMANTGSPRIIRINRYIVELFFPFVRLLGKLLGIERASIEDSYIKITNHMTMAGKETFAPAEVLLLVPHCLQHAECPHKITADVYNCQRCGKCSIDGLLRLTEESGVQMVVATGGTFARKFIKDIRPKAVIAVACERDLTSGIQEVNKIPVLGVLNERPQGPCYNTTVPLCKVQQAIDHFLSEERLP